MRIAIVTPGFSADDGDWCIPALLDFARALNDRDEAQVFATTYPHRCDEYRVYGIPVSSFGDGRPGRLATTRRMLGTIRAISDGHRARPFDLLHGFWCDHGGVVSTLAARRLGIPNVVTAMAGELSYQGQAGYGKSRRPIAGRLARFGASRADTLLVHSAFHAEVIRQTLPALTPTVVPFGVDTERFSPNGDAENLQGAVPIVCAGSLVPVKGHAVLLNAFAKALDVNDGLHLHIVGDGALREELEQKTAALSLTGAVSFHGHVAHDQLPRYFRAARFCVLASYFESHSMVAVEAAACGRATIGTAVGSLPQLSPEDLLAATGDAARIADSIVRLAGDVALAERLGRDAASVARDRYSLPASLAGFRRVYETTLRQRR